LDGCAFHFDIKNRFGIIWVGEISIDLATNSGPYLYRFYRKSKINACFIALEKMNLFYQDTI